MKGEDMAYLTDKEKRLLFSALTREKKVCVEVDKECCREAYEDTLESVVKNLEKKFYYDRFEKEIRAKAIDELKNKICMHFADWKYSEDDKRIKDIIELASESVEEIAEQMKGEKYGR